MSLPKILKGDVLFMLPEDLNGFEYGDYARVTSVSRDVVTANLLSSPERQITTSRALAAARKVDKDEPAGSAISRRVRRAVAYSMEGHLHCGQLISASGSHVEVSRPGGATWIQVSAIVREVTPMMALLVTGERLPIAEWNTGMLEAAEKCLASALEGTDDGGDPPTIEGLLTQVGLRSEVSEATTRRRVEPSTGRRRLTTLGHAVLYSAYRGRVKSPPIRFSGRVGSTICDDPSLSKAALSATPPKSRAPSRTTMAPPASATSSPAPKRSRSSFERFVAEDDDDDEDESASGGLMVDLTGNEARASALSSEAMAGAVPRPAPREPQHETVDETQSTHLDSTGSTLAGIDAHVEIIRRLANDPVTLRLYLTQCGLTGQTTAASSAQSTSTPVSSGANRSKYAFAPSSSVERIHRHITNGSHAGKTAWP